MTQIAIKDVQNQIETLDDAEIVLVAGGDLNWYPETRNGIPGSVGPNGVWVPWIQFGAGGGF